MAGITNKPEIRFDEFKKLYEENGGGSNPENPYAWEQRKLKEIAEFNPKSTLPDIFEYVDLESVVGTDMVSHRTETKDDAPSRAQRVAQLGDVFYQTVRPYQKNNYLYDLPYDNYVFSTGYAQMRPYIDSYFLLSRVQEEHFVKAVLDRSTGTSYPAINSNDLANIEIKVPVDSEEQAKIGQLFKGLETLIALHQRKYDKTVNVKKSMFEKMFPKAGAKIPEIRFDEFKKLYEENGGDSNPENLYAWEQRNLGDLSQIKTGASNVQDAVVDGEYPFFVRSENVERSNKYLFDGEAILIPGEGRLGDIYHYINGKFNFHQRVYKVSDFEHNIDGKFILYTMQKTFKRHALKHTVKATVDSLRLPMLTEYQLMVPQIEEQQKIGRFFLELDNLITLHQRELTKLKNVKKSMLEKMFV
jgi:type I restriction enzyme S subunit